jgi:hypothetical protein
VVLEKNGEDHLDRSDEMLGVHTVKEESNILHTTKRREANWIGHILHRNCLLKQVMEGKIKRAGTRGKRRKQLLDDLRKRGDTGT